MVCEGCFFPAHLYFSLTDEKKRNDFFVDHGVLPAMDSIMKCPKCLNPMKATTSRGISYRCSRKVLKGSSGEKKKCGFGLSNRKGTWFEKAALSTDKIWNLVGYWLFHDPPRTKKMELSLKINNASVVDWSAFCREVCLLTFEKNPELLGGKDKEVELALVDLRKEKIAQGKIVEGQWMLGGFERVTKRFFIVTVISPSSPLIAHIIQRQVLRHTTVYVRGWLSEGILSREDFNSLKTQHELSFQDSDNKNKTLHIDRLLIEAKKYIPTAGTIGLNYDGHVAEFLFKKKYGFCSVAHHFWKCVGELYPPAVFNLTKYSESPSSDDCKIVPGTPITQLPPSMDIGSSDEEISTTQ